MQHSEKQPTNDFPIVDVSHVFFFHFYQFQRSVLKEVNKLFPFLRITKNVIFLSVVAQLEAIMGFDCRTQRSRVRIA
jgi:hypothetical protein